MRYNVYDCGLQSSMSVRPKGGQCQRARRWRLILMPANSICPRWKADICSKKRLNQQCLTHALLLTIPYRTSIFVKGKPNMSDFMENVITVTQVRLALKQLLATYLSEKEESQRDEDKHDMAYWDSACQTIEDVAAALKILLEAEPGKQPESVSP
jgi:hypothetical protein